MVDPSSFCVTTTTVDCPTPPTSSYEHISTSLNDVDTDDTERPSSVRFESLADVCIPLVVFPLMLCGDVVHATATSQAVVHDEPLTDDEEWSVFSRPNEDQKRRSARVPLGRTTHDDGSLLTLQSPESSLTNNYHYTILQCCDMQSAGKGLGKETLGGEGQSMSPSRRNRSRLSLSKAILQADDSSYLTEGFVSVGDLPWVD